MWMFNCRVLTNHVLRASLSASSAFSLKATGNRFVPSLRLACPISQSDIVRRYGGLAENHKSSLVARNGLLTALGCCHLSTRGGWRRDWRQKFIERKLLRNEFKIKTSKYREKFRRLVKDGEQVSKKVLDTISNRIVTLPNVLCMFRIGVTPVVGYHIVMGNYEWALGFCAISAATDFLDGWIARTFNSESKLGALLDPLADKLLVASLTFTLTYVGLIPLFLTGLILTRDLLIILGGLYLHYQMMQKPRTMARFFNFTTFKTDRFRPTLISKINTGLQLSLVLVSLSSPIFSEFFLTYHYFLPTLQVATGLTTLGSGLNYLTRLR